ncbi:MAG: hypothetical protein ACT4PU_06790 [Planctomycetota bacterium]
MPVPDQPRDARDGQEALAPGPPVRATATPTAPWGHAAGYSALTLLSLALATWLLRALLPWPADGGLADKLAHFTAHRDDFEVLFLGSSRVARGYVPEVIDARLAAAGQPLRSFNLGVDAMESYETDYLLRHVLAQRPAALKYVVMELENWVPPRSVNPRFHTERSVHWHDARQTWAVLARTGRAPVAWQHKLTEGLAHARLFGRRALNLGRGVQQLGVGLSSGTAAEAKDESTAPSREEIAAWAGFEPADPAAGGSWTRVHEHWLREEAADFPRLVEALRNQPDSDAALANFDLEALQRQRRLIEEAGCVPIYAMGPAIRPKPYVQPLAQLGLLPVIFDFSRPELYPELYDPGERFDADHLAPAGARRFSEIFAREFGAWLATRPPPP